MSQVDLDETGNAQEDAMPMDIKSAPLTLMPYLCCIKCKRCRESGHLLVRCFHPICTACLQSEGETLTDTQQRVEIKPFPCLCCDLVSSEVIRNPFINLPLMTKSSKECSWCRQRHGTSCPAAGVCEVCNSWLCSRHIDVHNEVPDWSEHEVNAVQRVQETNVCDEHPGGQLEFYCVVCSHLTCSTCQLTKHKGHDYMTVLEKKIEIEKELLLMANEDKDKQSKKLQQLQKRMEKARQDLEKNTENARDEMLASIQKTIQQMREWHDEMNDYLASNLEKQQKEIDILNTSFIKKVNLVDYLASLTFALLKHTRPVDVIACAGVLIAAKKELVDFNFDHQSVEKIEATSYVKLNTTNDVEGLVRTMAHLELGCTL